jgi:hypothetical protein
MKITCALLGVALTGIAIATLLSPKAAAVFGALVFILSSLAVMARAEKQTAGRSYHTCPAGHRKPLAEMFQ